MKHLARLCGVALIAVGVGLAAGCSHIPGGIAPSNIPLDGRDYEELRLVSTTDSRLCLFGFLPISGSNSIRDAMEACIRRNSADALIYVTVEYYSQWWILFTRDVIKVEGVPIRFKRDRSRGRD